MKRRGLEIEISGQDPEDVRRELLETVRFLDENKDEIEATTPVNPNTNLKSAKTNEPVSKVGNGTNESDTEANNQQTETDSSFTPLSRKLGIPEDRLRDVFIVEEEDQPSLYLPDNKVLGSQKTDRQRRASLILLALWELCYDEERVKSSDLKESLMYSDVDETKMSNMYQGEGDRYFDRAGRGPSATIALTGPGKRQAMKEIDRLFEKLGELDAEAEVDDSTDETAEAGSLLDY